MTQNRRGWFGVRLGDAALACLAALCALVYLAIAAADPTPITCAQAVLALGFIPALLFWRTRVTLAALALLVLLAGWAITFLAALPLYTGVPPYLLAAPLAVYSTSRYSTNPEGRWLPRVVLALCAVGSLISPVMWVWDDSFHLHYRHNADAAITLGAHWALLGLAYFWALHRRDLAERTAQEYVAARERERVRIAQEIHDVLAHNLTLINVQSSAGLIAAGTDPQAATEALRTVKAVSAEALGQVRGIVATLRSPDQIAEPTPGTLAEIIAGFQGAGMNITTEYAQSTLDDLPAQHSLALRRIITEALTNVLRHQEAGSTVRLSITEHAGEVELRVLSLGRAQHQHTTMGTGTGLVGARERAESLGGKLSAQPTGDGWLVSACLPLPMRAHHD
ncbi:sensor histidine kinase [Corynebacterium lowii]|uniref:histidine kinase n=1 Tax=Corynebacterium lowii TaxID=1544413 RepID=A0A0Q1E1C9_9CORY|nr:histidine kinase [Corynebacterium lowii]KQB86260.1 Sensor histidine kinase DesK [Corynebacterium lowii]MDP9850745.1 signal transduction histidine kinase [Corynebacterium lowii]